MSITIRNAKPSDLKEYTELLQMTYEAAYTDDTIGLNKDYFSKKIFDSEDTQKYLRSHLVDSDKQKTWVAVDGAEMIGSITAIDNGYECELTGFYVAPECQGQGIGRRLWSTARSFAGRKDITLDIYTHNVKSIALYKKWGFEIDKARGEFYRHWPEWPEGLEAKCMYMRLRSS